MLMLQLMVTAALATAAPFAAQSLDGGSVAGEVISLSAKEVVLETESGAVTLPLDKLAALARQPAAAIAPAAAGPWVELVDGSGLPAIQFVTTAGQAKVGADAQRSIEVPTRSVRWVRLVAIQEPKLAKQWAEIVEIKAAADLLVVRKNDSLDYLEGVVGDIGAENCQFELDGETIPVKREKIAGIVYAHPNPAELPEAVGKLVAADGSQIQLSKFELNGDKISAETPAGTKLDVPLADVVRFDFSSGKVAYLSDLEPESAVFTPLVGFAERPQGLLGFFDYRRDIGFEQSPLRLDGREFRKGLALASRTELVYKLPGKFRLFRAMAGIDDTTRETGSVRLEIKGDGRTLWEGEVRGEDPVQELELEVGGVKRLEILADYGADLDVGDRLDLGNAHVTK